jgi:hypothetical protein
MNLLRDHNHLQSLSIAIFQNEFIRMIKFATAAKSIRTCKTIDPGKFKFSILYFQFNCHV